MNEIRRWWRSAPSDPMAAVWLLAAGGWIAVYVIFLLDGHPQLLRWVAIFLGWFCLTRFLRWVKS